MILAIPMISNGLLGLLLKMATPIMRSRLSLLPITAILGIRALINPLFINRTSQLVITMT
jgi:hypothetical protein